LEAEGAWSRSASGLPQAKLREGETVSDVDIRWRHRLAVLRISRMSMMSYESVFTCGTAHDGDTRMAWEARRASKSPRMDWMRVHDAFPGPTPTVRVCKCNARAHSWIKEFYNAFRQICLMVGAFA
jgi:hypothetical protein